MNGGRPRVRVVRFHLGEQEAALPADAVVDVEEPRTEHPHLAPLLGETPRADEAGARTLILGCPARGPLALRVDGPVQFGHLASNTLMALPAGLPQTVRGLVVGLWRRRDEGGGALGWRLSLEAVCGLASRLPRATGGSGAGEATVVGLVDGETNAARGR